MQISERDGVTLIQLTGGSATQSFSREFLPKIRDAVMDNIGRKAIVITGEGNFSQLVQISTLSRSQSMMETA